MKNTTHYIFLVIFIVFGLSLVLKAQNSIVINQEKICKIIDKKIEILHDPTKSITFDSLKLNSYNFVKEDRFGVHLPPKDYNFWIKFSLLHTQNEVLKYRLEITNANIDEIDLYSINEQGETNLIQTGDIYKFKQRDIHARHFVFLIPLKPHELKHFFIKINNKGDATNFHLKLWDEDDFLVHENHEHFLFGIYYGLVLFVLLLNLFFFKYFEDKAYLNYILYVFFLALFQFTYDGLTFMYLTSDFPILTNRLLPLSIFLSIIFLMSFTRKYLETHITLPKYDMYFKIIAYASVLFGVFTLLTENLYLFTLSCIGIIAPIANLAVISAGVLAYPKRKTISLYFISAFICLIVGVILLSLRRNGVFSNQTIIDYSMKIGSTLEILILSVALAVRFKKYQSSMVDSIKESQKIKDILITEINQANKKLDSFNKELDKFIYRASHDINGPICTIMGLSGLAIKECTDPRMQEYLTRIDFTSKKASITLLRIMSINEVYHRELEIEEVHLLDLVQSTFMDQKLKNRCEKIELEFKSEIELLYTDSLLLSLVFENLFDNSIKYRNHDSRPPYIKMEISSLEGKNVRIKVVDNGMEIDKKSQKEMFDMFFKGTLHSTGSGLGLYITKVCIEKLGGIISYERQGLENVFELSITESPSLFNKNKSSDEVIKGFVIA